MGYCNNPSYFAPVHACTPALKTEEIMYFFNDNCKGRRECEGSIEVAQMLNAKDANLAPEACWNPKSIIYLQYSCSQPLDENDDVGGTGLNLKRS